MREISNNGPFLAQPTRREPSKKFSGGNLPNLELGKLVQIEGHRTKFSGLHGVLTLLGIQSRSVTTSKESKPRASIPQNKATVCRKTLTFYLLKSLVIYLAAIWDHVFAISLISKVTLQHTCPVLSLDFLRNCHKHRHCLAFLALSPSFDLRIKILVLNHTLHNSQHPDQLRASTTSLIHQPFHITHIIHTFWREEEPFLRLP